MDECNCERCEGYAELLSLEFESNSNSQPIDPPELPTPDYKSICGECVCGDIIVGK